MLMRNVLLVVGGLTLLAGLALSVLWFTQAALAPNQPEARQAPVPAVMVAAHAIAGGTLLRPDDIAWQDLGQAGIRPGSLVRGQVAEKEFVGAVARRDFEAGEPLIASDLVKPDQREFLAAVLSPGMRSISITVDASQSASGLILPGDHVDVILIQSFAEKDSDPAHRLLGETVLKDVRAIAVDQALTGAPRPILPERRVLAVEAQVPKTVTLELTPRQAEIILVAGQLGRLGISVRSLESAPAQTVGLGESPPPVWASDVSPALRQLGGAPRPYVSGSTIETTIRRAPPPGAGIGASDGGQP